MNCVLMYARLTIANFCFSSPVKITIIQPLQTVIQALKMIELTFAVNVVCRTSAIRTQPGAFNEILETIDQKEKLPPMKVSNIFHVRPVHILKDAFQMWNMFKVGCELTICH
jgi:hypothetical protein